jgi:hypothetical protein
MRNSGLVADIHHEASQALAQLAQVETDCSAMALSVRTRLMGEEVSEDGEDGTGKAKVVHELRAYTTQVQQLEQARKYLLLLLKIQELE